jgi:hypothetical protein
VKAKLLITLLFLTLWGGLPAHAEQASSQTPIRIGVFVISILNLDPTRGSYTVLFYLWSLGPLDNPDPLSAVEFPRATSITELSHTEAIQGDRRWILKGYRCDMLNEWDLHAYPFDKHTLAVVFRPNKNGGSVGPIELDTADSGIAQKRAQGGWEISDFGIFKYQSNYESNFVTLESNAQWIVARFRLSHSPWFIFFRLMSGAYISVLIALLGCLLKTIHPPVFSGRSGMQVACLLAAVVNQREIGGALGARSFYSLPDTLHVLCYLCILTAFLITLQSRKLVDDEAPGKAVRWEKKASAVTAMVFILLNVACVWWFIEPNKPQNVAQVVEQGN